MSPGYGVVIRPEPRQLAGWQIRMSVPFMLSIDYLNINAHPRLPPTRLGLRVSGYACACYALTGRSGFGYYFHFTPGFRRWRGCTLGYCTTAPPVGGAQNSARLPSSRLSALRRDRSARQIPIYCAEGGLLPKCC